MKSEEIKRGDSVKIINLKDVPASWRKEGELYIGKKLTVRRIKESGGLLFNECCLGYSDFTDVERGLMPHRVKKIKSKK